jgi:glycosyltransferase involved in cell wall biosynthesis
MNVSYVKDTCLQKMLNRTNPLAPFLNICFLWKATPKIKEALARRPGSIVHFTSPVSPVLPYFRVPGAPVIIGPLNGNIHYPPSFRHRETASYRVRRWLHPGMQFLNRISFPGKRRADALLVAGGQRTADSLRMAGCRDEQFARSIDSGVLDRLYQTPRIRHRGRNLRFVQNGRLVKHKGTDLAIRSLALTKHPVELDIIGRGPELENLKALAASLSLGNRVRFVEWIADHGKVAERLRQYRAFVFPSLAEANGIVVQEALVQGLPVITLNWGGPSLLVTPETGVLIEPAGEDYVIAELAKAMDRLAEDGELAERMSIAGRREAVANGFLWSGVIRDWTRVYKRALEGRAEQSRGVVLSGALRVSVRSE